MVQASTRRGDLCLDPFAGSGTLGAVAAQLGRRYLLMDDNPEAVRVMTARLANRSRPEGVLAVLNRPRHRGWARPRDA